MVRQGVPFDLRIEPPELPDPLPTGVAQLPRRQLVWEAWLVELVFLFPAIAGAVGALAAHFGGDNQLSRIPTIVPGHPVENVFSYASLGMVVPLALLLLARTGQPPAVLGLGRPGWLTDLWPGLGLAVASFLSAVALALPFSTFIANHRSLFAQITIGHIPHYYVLYGLAVSAVTAIAEETLVSGYLLTRLEQLGWSPRPALIFSLGLRTSYHIYYGIGFLFTIPFGYYVTRSFQKRRRLTRPIVTHFVYDAVLFTAAILSAAKLPGAY
jgi:membrane protease YdiL (CAAX protease family)